MASLASSALGARQRRAAASRLLPPECLALGLLAAPLAFIPTGALSEAAWEDGSADDPAFWDRIYRVQGRRGRSSYEWYGLGYEQLREPLEGLLPRGPDVLVVGSGDSDMSAALAAAGWSVTSIDFSEQVTGHMRNRHPGLDFLTMDARNMTFEDGRFGAVVDKGLSDCIGTPVERRRYFGELLRVVRSPGGSLVVISQRPLEVPRDLGRGWACEPRRELRGPLFMEESPNEPPKPQPGTEGQIPYYLLACTSSGSCDTRPAEAEVGESDEGAAEQDSDGALD